MSRASRRVLSLRRGRVSAVVERLDGLERLEVDGVPCICYPQLTGAVAVGDDVVVNVQARELGLGSGGFDVLYVNLTRGLEVGADGGAHVMKLPYTPAQFAVAHGEQAGPMLYELEGAPGAGCSPRWRSGGSGRSSGWGPGTRSGTTRRRRGRSSAPRSTRAAASSTRRRCTAAPRHRWRRRWTGGARARRSRRRSGRGRSPRGARR